MLFKSLLGILEILIPVSDSYPQEILPRIRLGKVEQFRIPDFLCQMNEVIIAAGFFL
jgi:hypothetical protein